MKSETSSKLNRVTDVKRTPDIRKLANVLDGIKSSVAPQAGQKPPLMPYAPLVESILGSGRGMPPAEIQGSGDSPSQNSRKPVSRRWHREALRSCSDKRQS